MIRLRSRIAALLPERSPLRPADAMAGWLLLLPINAVAIVLMAPWPSGGLAARALHHAFDAGQLVAAGVASALAVVLWSQLRRIGLKARWPGWIAFGLAAAGLGWPILTEDLAGLAERLAERANPALLLPAAIVAVAAGIVGAGCFGRLLARPRWRWVGVGLAVAMGVLNHRLLRADYPGAHCYLAWAAAALAGNALAGVPWPLSGDTGTARRVTWGLWSVAAAWGGATTALPAPVSARLGLIGMSGAPLAPFIARLHAGDTVSPDRAKAFAAAGLSTFEQRWFESSHRWPVIASKPGLTYADPVVVLLTIDAVRADALDRFADRLPNLTRLRAESLDFTQARTPGSQTVYSVTSLFTGTYFSEQYWSKLNSGKDRYLWPCNDPTVRFPTLLTKAGVRTVTRSAARWMVNEWGVTRGFQDEGWTRSRQKYSLAPEVTDSLFWVMDHHPTGRMFVYTHYLDPHAPYDRGDRADGNGNSTLDAYVRELTYVDKEIGRWMAQLSKPPFAGRTLLVVSSDHGEAFGEHGTTEHATTLYEEQVRVPLLVWGPGVVPKQIDTPVTLLDVGPTVLDAFGQTTPTQMMGQSLLPFVLGRTAKLTRPIAAEGRLKQMLVLPDGVKLIRDQRAGTREIYDLKTDPTESRNLYGVDEAMTARMPALDAFFETHRIRRKGYQIPYRR